jgi:hypothetical protein
MYTAPTNYTAIKPPHTTIKTVNKNVARAKLHQFPRQKRVYCTLSASLWEPGALLPAPETIVKECNDCYWCVFSKLVHHRQKKHLLASLRFFSAIRTHIRQGLVNV